MHAKQKSFFIYLSLIFAFLFSLFLSNAVNAEAGAPAPGSTPAPAGEVAPAGGTGAETSKSKVPDWIKKNYPAPPGYVEGGGAIPECAFYGGCRDTNDLVQIFINQGKAVFGLIGMVALVAFVYGGFLMVFSFGESAKVQQGKDVMVAAVIGIIIVFSAYLIVSFILDALQVSTEFQAIK